MQRGPPVHLAYITWRCVFKAEPTNLRSDTVGAHEEIDLTLCSVTDADIDDSVRLTDRLHRRTHSDRNVASRVEQNVLQGTTVNGDTAADAFPTFRRSFGYKPAVAIQDPDHAKRRPSRF